MVGLLHLRIQSMELTISQAREYLASVGITLPDFMLQVLVVQANSINACLIGAGYPDGTALLIKIYLVGLFGLAQGDKYITSQTAPSGASQSFKYGTLADRWKSLLGLLTALDKAGCATALIPPNPNAKSFAGLWVARGCCHE